MKLYLGGIRAEEEPACIQCVAVEKGEELCRFLLEGSIFFRRRNPVDREDSVETGAGRPVTLRQIVTPAGIGEVGNTRHQVGEIIRPDPCLAGIGVVVVTVQNQEIGILEVVIASPVSRVLGKDVVVANDRAEILLCVHRYFVGVNTVFRVRDRPGTVKG